MTGQRKPRFFEDGATAQKKRAHNGPASQKVIRYECGEVLLPADGGQGVPGVGFIPGDELLLPWLPGVAGFGVDDPVFGVDPDPLAEFGIVPHGEPLGDEFGVVFDGCVVLPGLAPLGVVPGDVAFGVPFGEVDPGVVCPGEVCGVAVPAGGVAVWAGGVAVLAGGVAGDPGIELCPAELEPPAGAAPPALLCATAQLPQHNTADSNASFLDDMCLRPPGLSRLFEISAPFPGIELER